MPRKTEPQTELQVLEWRAPRLTKRNLEKYQRDQYLQNLPAISEAFFPALIEKMKGGNTKALELGAKIMRLIKDDGFSVVTNIVQNNQQEANPRFSFESLVRRLEARDKGSADNPIEITAEN